MPTYILRIFICLISCLFSSVYGQLSLPDTFHIKGANDSIVALHYHYIKDDAINLHTTEVIGRLRKIKEPAAKQRMVFNTGYTKSCYWFALAVQNDTSYTLPVLWSFYNNNLGFELYNITDTLHIEKKGTILSYEPLSKRQVQLRAPAFQLYLPPYQTQILLVRVFKLNTESIYFPSDFSTTDDITTWEVKFSFRIGRYIGYFIFVAIFNLFLGLLLKARIHLWHSLYIVAIVLYALSEYMFDILYLPEWLYPTYNHLPKMLFLVFALLFGMVEAQIFLEQQSRYPHFLNLFKAFKYGLLSIGVGLLIGSLLLPPQNIILVILRISSDLFFLAGTLVMLAFVFYTALHKNLRAIFYLVASSVLLLGYLDFIVMSLFNVRLFYILPGTILIGLIIEISLLTAAFIFNINKGRKETFRQLRQQVSENKILIKNLINIQEEERSRIAADLHDGLGPNLAALRLLIAAGGNNQQEIANLAAQAYSDVRNIAHNLIQTDLSTIGLYAALQKHLALLNQQGQTVFTSHLHGSDSAIPAYLSVQIFRIVSEAANNIIKHAHAETAAINIVTELKTIHVSISDNGTGMQNVVEGKGMGLRNIATRVAFIQGTFAIETSDGGTQLTIRIPLKD